MVPKARPALTAKQKRQLARLQALAARFEGAYMSERYFGGLSRKDALEEIESPLPENVQSFIADGIDRILAEIGPLLGIEPSSLL